MRIGAKQKRILLIIAILLALTAAVLLAKPLLEVLGHGRFLTKDYRLYQSFVRHHKEGTQKQDILEKLGYPEGYSDGEYYHGIPYADRESSDELILDSGVKSWTYTCYKYSDPAEPYRLEIYFGDDGTSEYVEFDYITGG